MKLDKLPSAARVFLLFVVLYFFFVSIDAMGASFKLFGKGFAETLLTTTSNPFIGLLIGILATSLVQSSSFTTSMIVGLVGGGVLGIPQAIPIVMGANVGTSVTNTLVSLGHITRKQEFKRAFAAATVHDFFNLLAVAIFLPLELAFGYLEKASLLFERVFEESGGLKFSSPLKAVVRPFVDMMKDLFAWMVGDGSVFVPILLLAFSIPLLFLCLKFLVDIMKSLVIGRIEAAMNDYLFQTIPRAMILGLVITALVQSSSITTSLAVPLVGAGILTVTQIFPYTLGANIGTTLTAIMASLVTKDPSAVAVAFAHLLFNISGCIVFIPLRRIPIGIAEKMGEIASERRYMALVYIGVLFYLIPILAVVITRLF